MKTLVALISVVLILIVVVLAALLMRSSQVQTNDAEVMPAVHIYASWETMEFDKCVAAWLITRLIDKDAEFVFYSQGTEITEGTVFDVPGAEWSRKHRKCTSQCVLETLDNTDSAVEEIVSMASKAELNFWQLDRWPVAQKCFYEVKEIMDQTPDPAKCLEKTGIYFDKLYSKLSKNFKAKER
jgi:hypothetical protein